MRTPNTFDQMKNVSTKSMDKTISKVIKGWQTRYWIQHQIFMLLMISNTTWKFKNQRSILKTWVEVPLNHNEKWTFPYINWIQLLLRNIDWNESISKMAYKKNRENGNTADQFSISWTAKMWNKYQIKIPFSQANQASSPMVCIVFPNPISSAKIPFSFLSYIAAIQSRPMCWYSRNECFSKNGTLATTWTNIWKQIWDIHSSNVPMRVRILKNTGFPFQILDFESHEKKNVQVPVTSKIRMSRRSTWNQNSIVDIQRVKLTVKKCVQVCMITITNIRQP